MNGGITLNWTALGVMFAVLVAAIVWPRSRYRETLLICDADGRCVPGSVFMAWDPATNSYTFSEVRTP
jgi:uncharacterized membrane protein YqjE